LPEKTKDRRLIHEPVHERHGLRWRRQEFPPLLVLKPPTLSPSISETSLLELLERLAELLLVFITI
jgi:hypothetical protein